ncbi:conserved hypothetical protein [Sphingomonas aurantiaca]|uniref:Uncharacterized protein n=1 Tax=Sphingomonas aurantiaca TaxID=185949 RepID=A0A5E7XN28_9SPHN|nr:conserved hypothetical protein [Sphingomonas aurantiaca]
MYTAFNRNAVTDIDIVFDKYMIANVAVGANRRTLQDMDESPYTCSATNRFRLN